MSIWVVRIFLISFDITEDRRFSVELNAKGCICWLQLELQLWWVGWSTTNIILSFVYSFFLHFQQRYNNPIAVPYFIFHHDLICNDVLIRPFLTNDQNTSQIIDLCIPTFQAVKLYHSLAWLQIYYNNYSYIFKAVVSYIPQKHSRKL